MPIKFFRILSLFIVPLLFFSCKDDKAQDEPDIQAPRTVLVYMVAANTLGDGSINGVKYDYRDIDEMLAAAESADKKEANILVYHSPNNETPSLKLITTSGIQVLKEYDPSPYSVTAARMKEVFNDMRTYAPASKYGLVLWSHASGWMFNNNTAPESGRSWGIDRRKEMSIPNLAKAVRGEGFDYIYFDCCLMGNIETLYELRGCADFIVASPTETPLDGMPYDQNIPMLASSNPDLAGAAGNTFRFYNEQPSHVNRSIAISVYDMSKIDRLATALRAIYMTNMRMPSGFAPQEYCDIYAYRRKFYDVAHYASSLVDDATLKEELNQALDEFVIYKANTEYMWSSLPLNNCNGLSTFIYTDSNTDADRYNYRELQWYNDVIIPAIN